MAGTFILKPYERRRDPGLFGRFFRIFGLIMLAAFYGLLCSVLPMQLLVVPAVPILIMMALILWMLPDVGGVYGTTMAKLLVAYAFLNLVWPFYIAVDVPGVPWVTPARICMGLMVAVFLFNLAKSAEFRRGINNAMSASPVTKKLFWAYVALTAISIPFSATLIFSLNKFINNQVFWTMMFILATYLATRPGFVFRLAQLMVVGVLIVSVAGLYEASIQRVIWMDHLPGFLQIDPALLETFTQSQARAGTDVYRVRGTMGVSLYYAEYLAMLMPLVLHFIVREKVFTYKVMLIAGAFSVAANMFLTNARSGMIGLLMSLVIYAFFVVNRQRKRDPGALATASMFYAYPMAVIMLAGAVLASARLRALTLGGGQHQASTDARKAQWEMGLPKIFNHPLGHGVGRANEALNYTNRGGASTIDSYYLSLLMDYGPLGFLCFIAMFGTISLFGFNTYNASTSEDQDIAGPFAVGLINFLVIKSVLSAEINIPLAFMMTGCIVGLMWQQQQARKQAPAGTVPDAIQGSGTATR